MYKMIYSDMDGTLLNSEKKISNINKNIIKKVQEREIVFGIATGRIYPAAKIYAKELSLDTPIICCNGAVVVDLNTNEAIISNPIKPKLLKKVVDIIKKYDVYFHMYDKDTIYSERYDLVIKYFKEFSENLSDEFKIKTSVVENIDDIIFSDREIYKVGVYFDNSKKTEKMIEELNRDNDIEGCKSMSYMYDVMAKGINKGYALKQLGEYLNIDQSEIVAIGDNENDISMIKFAGLGVAMENATKNIKNIADYITTTNDKDGVSNVIEKFIINSN